MSWITEENVFVAFVCLSGTHYTAARTYTIVKRAYLYRTNYACNISHVYQ